MYTLHNHYTGFKVTSISEGTFVKKNYILSYRCNNNYKIFIIKIYFTFFTMQEQSI